MGRRLKSQRDKTVTGWLRRMHAQEAVVVDMHSRYVSYETAAKARAQANRDGACMWVRPEGGAVLYFKDRRRRVRRKTWKLAVGLQ